MLKYVAFLLAAPIVSRLPRSLLSGLGVVMGVSAFAFAHRQRQAVLRNLSVVLPDRAPGARRRLALKTFIHGAWGYMELLTLLDRRAPERTPAFQFTGWEHLNRALADGQGVIMVTAHVGSPSLASQLVARRGVATSAVVEELQPPALHRLMVRMRGSQGMRIVTAGRAAVAEIATSLRRNEVVGLVCDRNVAGSGLDLPFFGRTTRMTTAPVTLALRTNAAILPAVAYRSQPFAGIAHVEPVVELARTGDVARDVREGTLRVIARLEALIREHPEQWAVFSDVWPPETADDTCDVSRESSPRTRRA
ncbi:MAG: hypothetical protein GEU73_09940 [Chloroflexi bacterium]|nr:hypothetical protein [Chloroflexota bacterium]